MTTLPIPRNLAAAARREGREGWLESLPGTVEDLRRRWSLRVGRPFPPGGTTAWVAPATLTGGIGGLGGAGSAGSGGPGGPGGPGGEGEGDLVLKLLWPHPEAKHEADALRLWSGEGAVVLHAVEELGHTTALLLERCRAGTPLSGLPEEDQDLVVADLLTQIWKPPPAGHPFWPLATMFETWLDEVAPSVGGGRTTHGEPGERHPPGERHRPAKRYQPGERHRSGDRHQPAERNQPGERHRPGPVRDPGLVRHAQELLRTLPQTADQEVLLATDLHSQNVLAARRSPWLLIDPKPYVGDPAYDLTQHMLNCDARLHTDPLKLARRMAGLTGQAPERVTAWLFARCVQESPEWPGLAEVALQVAPP